MRTRRNLLTLWLAMVLFAVGAIAPAAVSAQSPPISGERLAEGRYATMDAVLEKTFLGVDVLYAHVRFGDDTADKIRSLAAGRALDDALEDRIARTAAGAGHAHVYIKFLRDVTLDQFIDGVRSNLQKARRARMISDETYRRVAGNLPRWFGFLEERGIREGDVLHYRAKPGSLRTVYVYVGGREGLDRTDTGSAPPRAMLAGYFAPDSDLREPLIASLFD